MEVLNVVHKCHYCDDCMIIPNKYIDKYVMRHLKNFRKLEEICRISEIACGYILQNHPEIFPKLKNIDITFDSQIILDYGKYYRTRLFLFYNELTKKASLYCCDLCNKKACMFHYIHSYFIIHNCKKCNKSTTICGWCQEETKEQYYCQHCDEYKQMIYV